MPQLGVYLGKVKAYTPRRLVHECPQLICSSQKWKTGQMSINRCMDELSGISMHWIPGLDSKKLIYAGTGVNLKIIRLSGRSQIREEYILSESVYVSFKLSLSDRAGP